MPSLTFEHDGKVHRAPIAGDSLMLGRGSECEIKIPDKAASRTHCQIVKTDDRYTLVDLESHNGTLINGAKATQHLLAHGDIIQIGNLRCTFEDPTAVTALADPPLPTVPQQQKHPGKPAEGKPVPPPATALPRATERLRGASPRDTERLGKAAPEDASTHKPDSKPPPLRPTSQPPPPPPVHPRPEPPKKPAEESPPSDPNLEVTLRPTAPPSSVVPQDAERAAHASEGKPRPTLPVMVPYPEHAEVNQQRIEAPRPESDSRRATMPKGTRRAAPDPAAPKGAKLSMPVVIGILTTLAVLLGFGALALRNKSMGNEESERNARSRLKKDMEDLAKLPVWDGIGRDAGYEKILADPEYVKYCADRVKQVATEHDKQHPIAEADKKAAPVLKPFIERAERALANPEALDASGQALFDEATTLYNAHRDTSLAHRLLQIHTQLKSHLEEKLKKK